MPTYEFVCATCGPFEHRRSLTQGGRRPYDLPRYARKWPSVYTQHPVSFSPPVLCAVTSNRVQSQRWSNVRLLRNLYPPGHSNNQLVVGPGSSVMLRI
jgi:hypothetical protein